MNSGEEKLGQLLSLIERIPKERRSLVLDRLIALASSFIDENRMDIIININKTPHHNIKEILRHQVLFDSYIDLTEGNLSFNEMLEIPRKLLNALRKPYMRIGIVLTGHPLMQLLALSTTVASFDMAYAFIWMPSIKSYYVREFKKFRAESIEPIKNDYDIIFPVNPLSPEILQILSDHLIHIVCEDATEPNSWKKCFKKTISYLIGNDEAVLGIDCPRGLPAAIGTEIIEGMQRRLKLITVIDNETIFMELEHKSFRTLEFDFIIKYKGKTTS